jgi:cell division protein FtsL
VVPKYSDSGRSTKRWFPPWAIVLLVVLSIGTISLRLATVRLSYRISRLDREISKIQTQIEKGKIELAKLKSPERLKTIAEEMGLVPPDSGRHIRLSLNDEPKKNEPSQNSRK